jgi:hypothetical protein
MPQHPLVISEERAAKLYGIEVQFPTGPAGAPVVNPATFQLDLPAAADQVVGTVTATNSPTSFGIVSGGAGEFAIDNTGVLTVTALGSIQLGPGDRDITISATNASGTGQNVIVVEMRVAGE